MTGHSEFSVTVCRAVNFPSSEQLHGLAFERDSGELQGIVSSRRITSLGLTEALSPSS